MGKVKTVVNWIMAWTIVITLILFTITILRGILLYRYFKDGTNPEVVLNESIKNVRKETNDENNKKAIDILERIFTHFMYWPF